jgi:hypothetical protein
LDQKIHPPAQGRSQSNRNRSQVTAQTAIVENIHFSVQKRHTSGSELYITVLKPHFRLRLEIERSGGINGEWGAAYTVVFTSSGRAPQWWLNMLGDPDAFKRRGADDRGAVFGVRAVYGDFSAIVSVATSINTAFLPSGSAFLSSEPNGAPDQQCGGSIETRNVVTCLKACEVLLYACAAGCAERNLKTGTTEYSWPLRLALRCTGRVRWDKTRHPGTGRRPSFAKRRFRSAVRRPLRFVLQGQLFRRCSSLPV